MSKKVASLVLAAGASTRMKDEIKQLLPWKKTTLLGHTISEARSVLQDCYVVLGAYADKIVDIIPDEVTIIHNPKWQHGMGGSIAVGVSSILESIPDVDGVLIILGDQPLLDGPFYLELLNRYAEGNHNIVATSYGEKVGVPAIFDKTLFEALTSLHEDFGARHIIQEHLAETLVVNPKGREVDIDTLFEYNQITGNK